MTYAQAQEQAIKLSVKEARNTGKRITKEYNKAFDEIQLELKVLYAEAKKLNITETQYYNKLRQIGRLQTLSKDIEEILIKALDPINSAIRLNSISTITNQYYLQKYAVQWFSPSTVPFSFVNKTAVNLSTWWTDAVWKQITDPKKKVLGKTFIPSWGKKNTLKGLLFRNETKQLKWIKSAISQGLIQGRSLTQTTSLVRQAVDMSTRDTMRVVRTETLRNLNGGAYLNHLELKDMNISTKRKWVAVLDFRTRQQSATMDGQIADQNDEFHYPNGAVSKFPGGSGNPAYDINERCNTINVLPGQDPLLRRGLNPVTGKSEIMTYKDFPEWAKDNDLVFKKGMLVKNVA
jgi:hypothetical protein